MTTALDVALARSNDVMVKAEAQRSAEWPATITLTGAQFDKIATREWGLPTGTTIGRQWKASCSDGSWNIATFTRHLPEPTCCRLHRCIRGFVDDTPCAHGCTHDYAAPNQYIYDPKDPEEWTRRTGEQPHHLVEIKWSKIICPERGVGLAKPPATFAPAGLLNEMETSLL